MKIKKSFFSLLLLIIPFIILVGFSAWIIVYEFTISPQYQQNTISKYYGVSQEKTYNCYEQVPTPNTDIFSNSEIYTIKYYYKKTNENKYPEEECKPKDVGVYDVKIVVFQYGDLYGSCQVKFTITKKILKIKKEIIDLNYSTDYNYFAGMESYLKTNNDNKISFVNTDNSALSDKELSEVNYSISYFTNGNRTYKKTTTKEIIVGSTYACYIELGDCVNNYQLECDYFIIKFKSVLTNGIYYTIEDAIKNQNVSISLMGNASNASSHVITEFCNLTNEQGYPYSNYFTNNASKDNPLYNKNYVNKNEYNDKKIFEINPNVKFLIPFNDKNEEFTTSENDYTSGNVYSALVIPENIALVFLNNSVLQLGGEIGLYGSIAKHGVIMNNGLISMEENSVIFSYGFLKGNGDVILRNGSKAYDIMRMFDWPGGTNAVGFVGKAFPVISWTIHNISANLKIYSGAEYKGYSTFSVTGIGYQKPEFGIVGKNSSANGCLFKPSSNTKNTDYILKRVNPNTSEYNNSITEYNQTKGQRDIIEINGNYEDSSLSLTIKIDYIFGVTDYTFSTSKEICAPISFIDVIIKEESILTLINSSYTFLVGTSLTVEENSTLILSDGVYIAFDRLEEPKNGSTAVLSSYFASNFCTGDSLVSAKLILNGTIQGQGSICGIIESETIGARLETSNYKVSKLLIKNEFGEYHTVENVFAYGNVGDDKNYSYLAFSDYGTSVDKMFMSVQSLNNGEYYFVEQTDVKTIYFNYYLNNSGNLLTTKKIQIVGKYNYSTSDDESMKQYDGKYIYIIKGTECNIDLEFYSFNYWYLEGVSPEDYIGTIIVFDENSENGNNYDIYGNYSEVSYNINYYFGIKSSDGSIEFINDVNLENLISSFSISSFEVIDGVKYLQITTIPKYKEFNSSYWYFYNPLTLDVLIDQEVKKISLDQIKTYFDLISNNNLNLYCEFTNFEKYSIIFENYGDEFIDLENQYSTIKNGDEIKLPQTSLIDDLNYQFYISGWYLDEKFTESLIYGTPGETELFNEAKLKQYANSNKQIKLYAKSEKKPNVVNYYNEGDLTNIFKSQYFMNGQNIKVADEKNSNGQSIGLADDNSNSNYTVRSEFVGWTNSTNVSKIYEVGEIVSGLSGELSLIAVYDKINFCNLILDLKKHAEKGEMVSVSIIYYNLSNNLIDITTSTSNTIQFLYNTKITINITAISDGYKNAGSIEYKIESSDSLNKSASVTSNGSSSGAITDDTATSHIKITTSYNVGDDSCIVSGTLITLANGTKKPIEEVTYDDYILVFNHETGTYDISKMLFITHENEDYGIYEILELYFNNGNNIRIVQEHVLFDSTLNEYVVINKFNVNEYIGHEFYTTEYVNGTFVNQKIILNSYDIYDDYVKLYCPVTAYHMNCFANDILIMPSFPYNITGVFNIFDLDTEMKYNSELMKQDIDMYGLFTYEELITFLDYEITYETYLYTPAKYLKVSLGKGLITKEEILMLLEYLLSGNLIE